MEGENSVSKSTVVYVLYIEHVCGMCVLWTDVIICDCHKGAKFDDINCWSAEMFCELLLPFWRVIAHLWHGTHWWPNEFKKMFSFVVMSLLGTGTSVGIMIMKFRSCFCIGPVQWNLNALRPRCAYVCQKTRPSLAQIMACCLIGAKPLSEPMLTYCQFDHREKIMWNRDQK